MCTVPFRSTQSLEPVRGCRRRRIWVFHVPMLKSKSCCPSRNSLDDGCLGAAATAWVSALIESKHPTSKLERKILLTFRAGFSVFFITMILQSACVEGCHRSQLGGEPLLSHTYEDQTQGGILKEPLC